jgi:ABC-type transport system involved in multi-copper enzyme maturation permease subunit
MSHLRSAAVIARATVREAVRNRILMVAVAFAVAVVALSVAAAAVSMGERVRLVVDVGLAAASGLGSVIAIALAVASFSRELERHTAYPVLARPVPRWTFVLGKYAGVVVALVLVVTAMLLATAVAVWMLGDAVPHAFWPGVLLAWLEMAVVASVAILFSCYTGPVLAATFSAGLVVAGNFVGELRSLAERLTSDGTLGGAAVVRVLCHLLPDVQALSLRAQAANDLPAPPAFLGWAAAYAAAYAGVALVLAMLVFERRKAV